MKVYRFRDIYVYVMYVTSGPSLLIESTDSMIATLNYCVHGKGLSRYT